MRSLLIFACIIPAVANFTHSADLPTDLEISNAVEKELLYNATTPSYLIDVKTINGIVTLSGTVNNILARDRAMQIARTVKGVRAVVDNIKVDAPDRVDYVLKDDIVDALYRDPAADSYEIDVKVNDGAVTLSGNVESWQEKQLAAFVAKGVRGVKKINNNIDVTYATNRSDSEIKEEISESLAMDIRIDGALIDVRVNNGKVELDGIVGSANEKILATNDAWTSGVTSVNNENLEVKTWARDDKLRKDKYVSKEDDDIKDAVLDAFMYDPRVYSFNPDVSVRNGVVTLTGVVDNLKAKRAAEQDAKSVVGVVNVNNYLKVRPEYIPEDEELADDVENALKKDPIIDKWDVDVTADNGVVYLYGAVNHYFEKQQAGEIASKTKGALAVENNLDVKGSGDPYFYDYYGWNTYYPPREIDLSADFKTDREIKMDTEDQLWWSPYVNEDEVDVEVKNGKVILSGRVDTQREKVFAKVNAYEAGATDVENNLKVRYRP